MPNEHENCGCEICIFFSTSGIKPRREEMIRKIHERVITAVAGANNFLVTNGAPGLTIREVEALILMYKLDCQIFIDQLRREEQSVL